MLTLYTFGPHFGLPDASPFCIKALLLMKLCGLPFEIKTVDRSKAPKGKGPYLSDEGQLIADSHFILRHLETKHGVDFSGGYPTEVQARGFAVARMVEEHLYFLNISNRWLDPANFAKGPAHFFDSAPALLRPLIRSVILRRVRKTQHLQGLGRHTAAERLELAKGDLLAIEAMIGTNPFLLGPRVSGFDASAFAFVWSAECSFFESPIGDFIRTRPILMGYLTRMRDAYFPGSML